MKDKIALIYNLDIAFPYLLDVFERIEGLWGNFEILYEPEIAQRMVYFTILDHYEIVWWKLQKKAQLNQHNFKLTDLYLEDSYNSKFDNQLDSISENTSNMNYGYQGFGANNQANTYKKDNESNTQETGTHNRGSNKSVRYKQSIDIFNSYFKDAEISNELLKLDSKIKTIITTIF